MWPIKSFRWLLTLGYLWAMTACNGMGKEPVLGEVDVQLKWVHQAQFAGFYAADKEGLYAEENLEVSLIPGGLHLTPAEIIEDLVEGETDFAIVGGDQHLAARFRGEPVVAIAVIFQKNPYVYASLPGSGIQRPRDLVGKKVMVPSDAEVIHQALLRKLGLDPESVDRVSYQRDVAPLLSGEIDAQLVYRTGLGLAFDETEEALNWIWVEDYGIQFYADTLVTSEALIERNPELVEGFLRATIKGWRYVIENPERGVELTLQYDPDLTYERQARMVEAQTPLIHTGDVKIGWMERKVWEGMHDILLEGHDLVVEDIDRAFTMQFLDEIYDVSN